MPESNRKDRQQGFTLIELLLVITIIGIIAAIVIPNLMDALQKAKQRRTVNDVRAASTESARSCVSIGNRLLPVV